VGSALRTGAMRALVAGVLAALAAPAAALAHIERPSYWPDPRPDNAVTPPAGGKVPTIRTLVSALDDSKPGKTLVVCQPDSMSRLERSVANARKNGYFIRPTDHRALTAAKANALLEMNRRFLKRCTYDEIEPAADDARNNDRIVIMPGVYTEPTARSKPTHDKACSKYLTNTEFGDPGALSYAYQVHCPNDQNLIAVLGRKIGKGKDPDPPHFDRHGIPNLGPCIRCNVQMEGSGVSADDVIVDAGRVKSGNHGPIEPVKDVGIRADRADGFVLKKVNTRHAGEHGVYIIESDGYNVDRFKAFYNGEYGLLTFVEDHGLVHNCEAVGHADSGVYPGAPAETGMQRAPGTKFRYNQEIRGCDLHHNLAGYSATDGNAVHVHHVNFYDNTLGVTTDVVTAAGHPGFPDDSELFESNRFYSNNFNPYTKTSDVEAKFPFPIGTGLWIAGGNWHKVRNNLFYDNWRRGTMTFAVPDAIVCGPDSGNAQKGCNPDTVSTSFYNRHFDNVMGRAPDGRVLPNGTDFWWDRFPGNRGNCWYRNKGPRPITTDPAGLLPDCVDGTDPATSVGDGNSGDNEPELLNCAVAFETRDFDPETSTCPWLRSPPRPGSAKAAAERSDRRLAGGYKRFCNEFGSSGTCKPSLAGRLRLPRAFAYQDDGAARPKLPPSFNLQLYLCKNWKHDNEETRRYVIRRLREITSGQVSGGHGVRGHGTVLPDDVAHRLFDAYCSRYAARGFLLYKVYGFAAGFVGGTP
jgi:hypothetical protein